MDRAFGFDPKGCMFESCREYKGLSNSGQVHWSLKPETQVQILVALLEMIGVMVAYQFYMLKTGVRFSYYLYNIKV